MSVPSGLAAPALVLHAPHQSRDRSSLELRAAALGRGFEGWGQACDLLSFQPVDYANIERAENGIVDRKPKKKGPKPAACMQYGALPYRFTEAAALEVLIVTTRQSKRWIIPKGWPIKGLTPSKSAAREAFEEAGVIGRSVQGLSAASDTKRRTKTAMKRTAR
jgi:8-oxo-dGTP pyrophosphatase MutT (NUDIX family)